jgi:hypothetical protein
VNFRDFQSVMCVSVLQTDFPELPFQILNFFKKHSKVWWTTIIKSRNLQQWAPVPVALHNRDLLLSKLFSNQSKQSASASRFWSKMVALYNEVWPKTVYCEVKVSWDTSFYKMLYDFRITMMRIITLFTHALFTTGLYWTKFDSIQVTLRSGVDNNASYKFADQSYTGLIFVALLCLFIELFYAGLEIQITVWSVLHLFLDFVACLFTAWIALDGLPWTTYSYVFVFCV